MKVDGKAIAQAMMRRKDNEKMVDETEKDAKDGQEEMGDHIAEMSYFAECLKNGDHEKAHSHLSNMMRMMSKKDVEKEV